MSQKSNSTNPARAPHHRKFDLPFAWPALPFHIVLVEPEIPPNTGSVSRMCAATGSVLHLVEPMGFKITDAKVRRAGLDYWDAVDIRKHASWEAFLETEAPERFFLFSTGGRASIYETSFTPGDYLIFGSETKGLADSIIARWPDRVRGIPMRTDHVRSLNLANSVAIVVYEALRQAQQ